MALRYTVLALTCFCTVAAADPSSDPAAAREQAFEPDKPDTLLKAIIFALSGKDDPTFVWKSRAECVVTTAPQLSAQLGGYTDTFYLNNVDFSRLRYETYDLKFQDHVEHYVKLELHGEGVIRQVHMPPVNGAAPPQGIQPATEYSYNLETAESQRVVRAWQYIYSHGCRSAKTSF